MANVSQSQVQSNSGDSGSSSSGVCASAGQQQISSGANRIAPRQPLMASGHLNQQQQQQQPNYLCPSNVFQQVKQTQASLARLSRVHQQLNAAAGGQNNQSSQQLKQQQQQQAPTIARSTTFVDCLIRRFKDCFSEDCCTVPMFVVGNLSPGSDGTHLILPPCVSLGGQNIGRFAGPKNMRLMNSIRESCKSIEELDLGGNKLNDLIEVYKILQCTPNLKFLNLSENDLSRSSPVAMATSCSSSASSSSSNSNHHHHHHQQPLSATISSTLPISNLPAHQWSSSSIALARTCLGPLNQDQQQTRPQVIGSRRHSTLGQPAAPVASSTPSASSSSAGPHHHQRGATRVAEARRLAAAAALAQSKKTSTSVASKLTSSAAAGARCGSTAASARRSVNQITGARDVGSHQSGGAGALAGHRHPAATATTPSTMHLARSLSSLSAKDVRSANTSLSRLASQHRANAAATRRASNLRSSATRASATTSTTKNNQEQSAGLSIGGKPSTTVSTSKLSTSKQATDVKTLFATEPTIDESDDVDMSNGETPVSTSTPATVTSSSPPVTQRPTTIGIVQAHKVCANTTATATNYRRTFESIKALALNNTGCQWRVVCSILSRMPNLEELHLSLNNYERIDLDPNEFRHCSLKRLYLCNNPKLTNWEELDKLLSAFPSLEALSIADCNISQIPENLGRARNWRKICGLNINGWPIKEWPVIERLNQLPSLVDLKCRNLEVLSTIDEPRHHLIARLPKLQRLNGSEIEEREHAEKAFLRFFMANSHLERPSRFHELVQIHGEVIGPVDVDVDLSPPSSASVRVVFLNKKICRNENDEDIFMSEDFLAKLMDSAEPPWSTTATNTTNNVVQQQPNKAITSRNLENMEEVTSDADGRPIRLFKDDSQEVVAIDVDLRQSVRKFKSTLASLFGLNNQNDVILYYIDHEMVGLMGPELIKHNQKKLWNYNVQDGDQFIVEER